MLLDLKDTVLPGVLETANNLKAAKEIKQKQINEERDQAYEELSKGKFRRLKPRDIHSSFCNCAVKELRIIEAEIAMVDLEIAETLSNNIKLEQQYQDEIIKLAKLWKKQQV